ncbi:MAG TPA: hypothetical protein VII69_10680, partial [Candidatus Eremiobacteraceae bacterium]
MIDSGFVPLVPRRLVGGQASLAPSDVGEQASLAPPDVGGQASLAPFAGERRRGPSLTPINTEPDEIRIRAAAVELAAAACARALRYAVDRNPRLLARFVDDALRAAGSPKTATVRVAPPMAVAAARSTEHDVVADHGLSPGDVFVDCDAGTV